MALRIEQFMCRSDNFGVLVHDEASGETASIDAPEADAIIEVLERNGWQLHHILCTHHHVDHVDGNAELKRRYDAKLTAPAAEAAKIDGIDHAVRGGDTITVCGSPVEVVDTPGHTLGHVSYHFPDDRLAFTADCLFSLGCGRIFEGDAAMMHASMQRLAALPAETMIYCGHEYTETNARFALTVDPDNAALRERADEVFALRAQGAPTLPVRLAQELATNPFLRVGDPAIRSHLGMADASDAEAFAEIRRRKDSF